MKILFICTHNRCRSILSEAICNHLAKGRIQAFSAGSQPVGQVHPLSIKYLEEHGIATEGLRSQSWEDFAEADIDVAITVCDSAAGEQCPLWMGESVKVHWGLPDPSKLEGTEDEIKAAFYAVMETIERRVNRLLGLDMSGMDKGQREAALKTLIEENA